MRVLLTGAAGFMGRNMLLAFPPAWEVVALHRGPLPLPITGPAQSALFCDLADAAQLERVVATVGKHFDACLYLASNTSVPDSVQHPAQDLTSNAIGVINTLQAFDVEHLVYFSSGAVYDNLSGDVGPETFLQPALPYAISKWAAEHYVRAFVRHHHNPRHATIVRFAGAYGPYEAERKVYTKLVRRFAFERQPEFTVIGDGENFIDAMYVDDAVRATLAVLQAPPPTDVLTIDMGEATRQTINDVVRRGARAFGLEARILHSGVTPAYVQFRIDPQPFFDRYGVVPTVTLEDGLQRLAAHLRTEGTLR